MRRFLLVLLTFALFSSSFAQICTPTLTTGSGFATSPDSAQNLPAATATLPYNETIQLRIAKDTMLFGNTIPIDSVVLTQVIGLPSTITYACNPGSCSFKGGSADCIVMSGTPGNPDIGNHPLQVVIVAHSGKVSLPDTLKYYHLTVNSPSGFNTLSHYYFDVAQNFPNPLKQTTEIDFNIPVAGTAEFKVYNLLGTVLYKANYSSKSGYNAIIYDGSNLAPGMYFYSLSDGTNTITHRLLVDKR